MKPAEMAEKLLALADGECTKQLGEAGYSCREIDRLAFSGSQCERCEACDQLAKLREPWKSAVEKLQKRLDAIGDIVGKYIKNEKYIYNK